MKQLTLSELHAVWGGLIPNELVNAPLEESLAKLTLSNVMEEMFWIFFNAGDPAVVKKYPWVKDLRLK